MVVSAAAEVMEHDRVHEKPGGVWVARLWHMSRSAAKVPKRFQR